MRVEMEKEAAERERLRLEVEKLESAIDTEVIIKQDPSKIGAGESSGSEISEDEDDTVDDVTVNDSNLAKDKLPEENEKEMIKRQLIEKLQQKENIGQSSADVDKKEETSNEISEIAKVDTSDYVDIFADSGDDEKQNSDVEDVEKMEPNEEQDLDVKKEEDAEVVPAQDKDEVDVSMSNEPAEEFEKTLKTLSNIKNKMEDMTKEELEEALKAIPSLTNNTTSNDGRSTPVHLRDIQIPLKSLTDYVHDKRALYKQVFRNINKKEFKFMLPKYLRVS